MYRFSALEVPSGQIGWAWEWAHWIGRYMFWFFNFDLEYLRRVQSSELLLTKMNPTSCLFGSRVGLESFLPIFLSHFYWLKKSAKVLLYLFYCGLLVLFKYFLLTSRNPKNNCWLSRIFGARFGRKDRGLCPYNPWSMQQGGWLDAFLYESSHNFSNIQRWN